MFYLSNKTLTPFEGKVIKAEAANLFYDQSIIMNSISCYLTLSIYKNIALKKPCL